MQFNEEIEKFSGLGDSLVNFIYSLAVSKIKKIPVSKRASNEVLSKALVDAGLRESMKKRVDKHYLADYAEGLIFYAWKNKFLTIEECVDILLKNMDKRNEIKAFSELLRYIEAKIDE